MSSEFKNQIEEWIKRREEQNRPEIKDTTHSTDPGRLIPEEREEEDHNFYSKKIKEYFIKRLEESVVNKSEELEKAPILFHDDERDFINQFAEENSPDGKHFYEKVLSSSKTPEGLWHHHFKNNSAHRHLISKSPNPKHKGVSNLIGMSSTNGLKIIASAVHSQYKGKGYGKIAYREAAKAHGALHSDTMISRNAEDVYNHLSDLKDFKVNYPSKKEGRIKVKYKGTK